MRVVHVISGVDSRAGGPASAMAGLCKAQRGAGLEVRALATSGIGQRRDVADDLEAAGVKVTVVGPGSARDAVAKAVQDADVVHVHGAWESVLHHAAVAARKLGKPYVITPHGMLTRWSLAQKAMKKRLYLAWRLRGDLKGASAIHCTSQVERGAMSPLGLKTPVIVEPLGIDLDEFAPCPALRGAFRRRFASQFHHNDRILLFLGRIHPGKGLEDLVPALAKAMGEGMKHVKLVVVGPDSGGYQATIERLIDRHGVREHVLFTGMLRGQERLEALADTDLFALPSEHENFGLVVVEALACGVPAVLSDGVAIHDEVSAGHVGSVVGVHDVPALARELGKWMSDQSLRRDAGERARALVADRFTWPAIARRWVEHYRNLSR